MNDREPPGYDDWFDEPEPPTLEQGRAGRPSYDAPSGTEEDVWTLPEDEPRRSRRPQRGGNVGGLTTTQIAIIAIAGVVIIIALIAAFGGFSSGTPATTPSVNTHTTLPTTTTITTTITVKAPTQPLQEGSTNKGQVVLLQKALISLDYLQPPADGSFGPATKTAVESFQSANGLTPDGQVGPETLKALKQALGG
jgi:Putative peptidoglycan binding domain